MKAITLSAHFDGRNIQLDEPFELPSDAPLLVTVLPSPAVNTERDAWRSLSRASLARAYGDNEPDYPDTLISQQPDTP